MPNRTVISQDPGLADAEQHEISDKKMVLALLAIGHRPVKIESEEGNLLIWHFLRSKVDDDVNDLLSGKDRTLSIFAWWAADAIWALAVAEQRTRFRPQNSRLKIQHQSTS